MVSQSGASSELYNLRWNSYLSNLINVFSDHQNNETLVDVTLGCEGQFVKVHRLILSACSGYFQKLFQTHPSPQVLILLNDVKFDHLRLIVQFMYKGEVKVADSDMPQFLQLGRMLQIKGLCSVDIQDRSKQSNTSTQQNSKEPDITPEKNTNEKLETPEINKPVETEQPKEVKIAPVLKKRKLSSSAPLEAKKKIVTPPSPVNSDNGDPSHIPRPPNAFMIFANQWRKKLAVEYPNESNKDISVRLGYMWKSLSPEIKDSFYEDARKADEEHKLKYPGYFYSPKEARHRKAIASITKTGKQDSLKDDASDLIEHESISIKSEDGVYDGDRSVTPRSNVSD